MKRISSIILPLSMTLNLWTLQITGSHRWMKIVVTLRWINRVRIQTQQTLLHKMTHLNCICVFLMKMNYPENYWIYKHRYSKNYLIIKSITYSRLYIYMLDKQNYGILKSYYIIVHTFVTGVFLFHIKVVTRQISFLAKR